MVQEAIVKQKLLKAQPSDAYIVVAVNGDTYTQKNYFVLILLFYQEFS